MPSLYDLHFSARMIGVNIVPNKAPHSFDTLVYTDDDGGDDVVVDLLSCDDDVVVNLLSCDYNDDDDGDKDKDGGGFVLYKPQPPWNRYHAMLKREKERCLDMEFFDLYLYNRKKAEDRRTQILDWHGSDDARDDARDGDDGCLRC